MAAMIAMPYSRFAAEYDTTIGIPFFRQTREFFERLIRKYGIKFQSAADLGCGTGLFARYLKIGYGIAVFAVDLSEPMLRVAQRNCCGTKVVLLRQDIRSLRLPHPVDLITANFDTLNHILNYEDLLRTLTAVANNLNPGGHFIFDVITNCLPLGRSHSYVRRFYHHRRRVTQQVRFDPIRKMLSLLVAIQSPANLLPIVERHRERVYSLTELGGALQTHGFVIRGVHDAQTMAPTFRCSPRVIVVARKK